MYSTHRVHFTNELWLWKIQNKCQPCDAGAGKGQTHVLLSGKNQKLKDSFCSLNGMKWTFVEYFGLILAWTPLPSLAGNRQILTSCKNWKRILEFSLILRQINHLTLLLVKPICVVHYAKPRSSLLLLCVFVFALPCTSARTLRISQLCNNKNPCTHHAVLIILPSIFSSPYVKKKKYMSMYV